MHVIAGQEKGVMNKRVLVMGVLVRHAPLSFKVFLAGFDHRLNR